jgi:hypothetical protein
VDGSQAEGHRLDSGKGRRSPWRWSSVHAGGERAGHDQRPGRQSAEDPPCRTPAPAWLERGLAGRPHRGPEHLQREGKVARGLEPSRRFLLQAALDHLRDGGRHLWWEGLRIRVENAVPALHRRCAREGPVAGEHLVQNGAEAEDVGARIERLSPDLLG